MKKRYWLLSVILLESSWVTLWLLSFIFNTDRHDTIPVFFSVSIIVVIMGALLGWIYGKIKTRFFYKSTPDSLDKVQIRNFINWLLIILAIIAGAYIVLFGFIRLMSGGFFGGFL